MRSSRLGPWKLAGRGGNWPSPVMAPQQALSMDLILAGAVEVHGGDAAVGQDGEADEGLALLVEGWARLFGNQGVSSCA